MQFALFPNFFEFFEYYVDDKMDRFQVVATIRKATANLKKQAFLDLYTHWKVSWCNSDANAFNDVRYLPVIDDRNKCRHIKTEDLFSIMMSNYLDPDEKLD